VSADLLTKPLDGIKVLDLTRVLAGPLCTQMLGDLGAHVIKIEPCEAGDESRGWQPQAGDTGTAYLAVNRNKKSMAIDLRTAEGLQIVHRLARISDVVVESNSTGASDRLGVGYETLQALNPSIVYCSISGYGQTGPMKDAKGYDLMLQAFSGILDLTGLPGGEPVRSPFSPIDQATGHHAVIGILAALMQRIRSGKGAFIEVSLFETAVQFVSYLLQAYWSSGTLPAKVGCEHPSLVPYQAFQAADRTVLIGIANDALWKRFCRAFDLGQYIEDARFRTNSQRVLHRAETVALVQKAIHDWKADDLLARLVDIGVPCAPVHTIGDLSAHEHTAARGIIGKYVHRQLGPLRAVVLPIQFNGEPRTAGTAPPTLGEHTAEVLTMLGYVDTEIAALKKSGALGKPSGNDG
jgi:crotonobetainyl-CoA:carnitine CoA-transferase CaiB-like acyl-CoA transferase